VKLLVATRSPHKMDEIRQILADVPDLEILSLDDAGVEPSPEEEGLEPHSTFRENARSKARYFHEKTGLPTVADDSGLEVDALEGRPGVRSKRFAQDDGAADQVLEGELRDKANNRHLVRLLADVSPEDRTARYVCVAVLLDGEREWAVRGEAEGRVVDEARGEGGFGYDPHMLIPELDATYAEVGAEAKNARSHRGRAFRALARRLRDDAGREG